MSDAITNEITSFSVNSAGALTWIDEAGAAQGLGIATPTAIETVTLGGETYAIVAASGSSSLSVLKLGADGSLTAVDHIIDDLHTRFASVTALETVTIGERVFVLAGGADDGVSLFTLLPDGRLLHLAQVADSMSATLANVSAIAAQAVGTNLQVFASSGIEPGISEFSIDPGADGVVVTGTAGDDWLHGNAQSDLIVGGAGNDTLAGWNGDDIILDGSGQDTLSGNAGADIFVFTADGQIDTVTDFNRFEDRLDLSSFALFHSASQLTVTPTSDGAILTYGDETIVLRSFDKTPLTQAQILGLDLVGESRVFLESTTPTIAGTSKADTLTGSTSAERILGNAGDDVLSSGGGGDDLDGGEGNDTVTYNFANAGVHANLLDASTNTGWASGDVYTSIENLTGSNYADTLIGNAASNVLNGGAGNDQLFGNGLADSLFGGSGNDTLSGDTGNDRLFGESGNDVLNGGDHDDALFGGIGNDTLNGDAGNDRLYGGAGFDMLYGGSGDDQLSGDSQADSLFGGSGNDTLSGDTGNDRLFGESGNDVLNGGDHDDALFGGIGNDTLNGDAGNDRLYGGAGVDVLNGGSGNDWLTGDSQADTFVFADGFGADVITDFEANNSLEKIDLSALSSLTSFAQLSTHMTQVGADVVIDALGGNTITLLGVSLAELDAGDFVF